jgi:hypothetical protein
MKRWHHHRCQPPQACYRHFSMRILFMLALVIAALWLTDAYVFDGRYGGDFELQANNAGRHFYRQVQIWVDQNFPTH